jgi:hypothetical protein
MNSEYNLAIQSSADPRSAYVSVLGQPDTTHIVSAKSAAELVRKMWNEYQLAPTGKQGVFKLPGME